MRHVFMLFAVVRIWEREKEKKRERILWRGVVAISLSLTFDTDTKKHMLHAPWPWLVLARKPLMKSSEYIGAFKNPECLWCGGDHSL